MAYNNTNKYLRAKKVQDVYLLHKTDGVNTRFVFQKFIKPEFNISLSTFYTYLSINTRKELRQLGLFE